MLPPRNIYTRSTLSVSCMLVGIPDIPYDWTSKQLCRFTVDIGVRIINLVLLATAHANCNC